jgi:mRNA-degrading endonuclease RelE of RelBE toxin-antitoxin system
MATVFATSRFERDAKRLLTQQERAMVRDAIASNPERHPVIPGTGGVRKARWGRRDKGKSGGVRLIYYYWGSDDEVYLLHIYAKSAQAEMSAVDRKVVKTFVEGLKRAKEENRRH